MPSFLPPDAPITLDLEAAGEEQAIRAVADLLAGKDGIRDQAAFVGAVLERQKINPPLLGSGIALPHARTAAVSEIVFAAARGMGGAPGCWQKKNTPRGLSISAARRCRWSFFSGCRRSGSRSIWR